MKIKFIIYVLIIFILVILTLPFFTTQYQQNVLTFFFIYAALALSYDVLGGQMGYMNLGHGVFYGLGAYAFAILSKEFLNLQLPLIPSIIASFFAAGFVVACFGWLLSYPFFRLRGFYFAVATLGFISLVNLVVSSAQLGWLTGGFTGISLPLVVSSYSNLMNSYYLALAVFLISAFVLSRVTRSKLGLALISIREDEDAAESSGINTAHYKRLAMFLSALLAGFAGAAYMWFQTHTNPRFVFSLDIAFLPITMALLGGTGTILGPIIGAAIFTLVYQMLLTNIPAFSKLIIGSVLLCIGLAAPRGIIGVLQQVYKKRLQRPR
ncbi:MAG: branched-chain amino acid ABC transporter permease [Nitrososphaerales archaeon]